MATNPLPRPAAGCEVCNACYQRVIEMYRLWAAVPHDPGAGGLFEAMREEYERHVASHVREPGVMKTTVTTISPQTRYSFQRLETTRWSNRRPRPQQIYLEHPDLQGEHETSLARCQQLLTSPTVAIVGSRHTTAYGKRMIDALMRAMAAFPFQTTILSGVCPGADEAAHEAALRSGLPTIGILPLIRYARLRALQEKILRAGGYLLSEYPQRTPWRDGLYLERDGITTALADVVVVIQAGLHSGSMATARRAIEQGKPVWVPRSVREDALAHPEQYSGIRRLLLDKQATGFQHSPEDLARLQTLLTPR